MRRAAVETGTGPAEPGGQTRPPAPTSEAVSTPASRGEDSGLQIDTDAELFAHLRHFENDPLSRKPIGWVDRVRIDRLSTAKVREIGYGFTQNGIEAAKRYGFIKDKNHTIPDAMTRGEADSFLRRVIIPTYQAMVDKVVGDAVKLTPAQRNALASFAFNLGEGSLKTLVWGGRNRLGHGNINSIRHVLPLYRKAGGKVRKGLVRRRKAELVMFERDMPSTNANAGGDIA